MRLLVVDDEELIRRSLARTLKALPAEVVTACDGNEAAEKLAEQSFDLVLSDLRMPLADGFSVLRTVRERRLATPVIIMTGHGTVEDAVAAMRAGATNFLAKPFGTENLLAVIRATLGEEEPNAPAMFRSLGHPQAALIGSSQPVQEILRMIETIGPTDSTVLITGESGTGKEIVARLLHATSPRATKPLVVVNCGAIPAELVESELFGHARGAFTGAVETRTGRFVQSDGGTLFLDEIGDLPLGAQVKLLRVLQEREVTPVGASQSRKVDVRIIAATHRDLEGMVAKGTFREDLFYRVNVLPVELPPLRQRRADVRVLLSHFLEAANRRLNKSLQLAPETIEVLQNYAWPGNVRELENLIERLAIVVRDDIVKVEHLPSKIRSAEQTLADFRPAIPDEGIDLRATLEAMELGLIDGALQRCDGNITKAAALLGLNRTTLSEKLQRRKPPEQ